VCFIPVGHVRLALEAQRVNARVLAKQAERVQGVQGAASSSGITGSGKVGVYWSQLPVMNHAEELRGAAARRAAAARVAQKKALGDKDLLRLASAPPYSNDPVYHMPYIFDLAVRPPTTTWDLLQDYLQVKYQDVLARKDAVQRVVQGMGVEGPVPLSRLSPAEVSELNRQAGDLFEKGDVVGYTSLMSRLASHGLLNPSELTQHTQAAQLRAAELRAAEAERQQSGAAAVAGASPAAQQAALAAALSGSSGTAQQLPLRVLLDAAAGGQGAVRGRQLWEAGAKAGGWAAALSAHAAKLIQEKRAQAASDPHTAKALAALQPPQPASWEAACGAWDAYISSAGSPPHMQPS